MPDDNFAEVVDSPVADERPSALLAADDGRDAVVGVGDDEQVVLVHLVVGVVNNVQQNRQIEQDLKIVHNKMHIYIFRDLFSASITRFYPIEAGEDFRLLFISRKKN